MPSWLACLPSCFGAPIDPQHRSCLVQHSISSELNVYASHPYATSQPRKYDSGNAAGAQHMVDFLAAENDKLRREVQLLREQHRCYTPKLSNLHARSCTDSAQTSVPSRPTSEDATAPILPSTSRLANGTAGHPLSPSDVADLAAIDTSESHCCHESSQPCTAHACLRHVTLESLSTACGHLDMSIALLVFELERLSHSGSGLEQSVGDDAPADDAYVVDTLRGRCLWVNDAYVRKMEAPSTVSAVEITNMHIMKNMAIHRQVVGFCKNVAQGQPTPVSFWTVYYYRTGTSELSRVWMHPVVLAEADGKNTSAALLCTEAWVPHTQQFEAMVREHMCLKYTPCMVTLLDHKGCILSQNSESCAAIGCHASLQMLPSWREGVPPVNYLRELIGSQVAYEEMLVTLEGPEPFQRRMMICSPLLRSWFGINDDEELWQRVHITRVRDPATLQTLYCVAQIDITDAIVAERHVSKLQKQQQALLKEILPQQVVEHILAHKAERYALACSGLSDCDRRRCSSSIVPCQCSGSDRRPSASTTSTPLASPSVLPRQASLHHSLSNMHMGSFSRASCGSTLAAMDPHATGAGMAGHQGGSSTAASIQDDTGGIWLTQQDVMGLATYHSQVTILFADIKGFTDMSQKLHPSQVMLFLNTLYSVWDTLLDTHGVYKVETIGDSYMVSGGLFCYDEASHSKKLGGFDPQHAQKVLDFAKAMLEAAQALTTPLGQPVQVRVGVHSGPCMSGVVGQKMPRFCLYGDAINTASRMESTGQPGCIHASQATYELLQQEPWQSTGGVFAKGKGNLQTYLLPVGVAVPAGLPLTSLPEGLVESSCLSDRSGERSLSHTTPFFSTAYEERMSSEGSMLSFGLGSYGGHACTGVAAGLLCPNGGCSVTGGFSPPSAPAGGRRTVPSNSNTDIQGCPSAPQLGIFGPSDQGRASFGGQAGPPARSVSEAFELDSLHVLDLPGGHASSGYLNTEMPTSRTTSRTAAGLGQAPSLASAASAGASWLPPITASGSAPVNATGAQWRCSSGSSRLSDSVNRVLQQLQQSRPETPLGNGTQQRLSGHKAERNSFDSCAGVRSYYRSSRRSIDLSRPFKHSSDTSMLGFWDHKQGAQLQ